MAVDDLRKDSMMAHLLDALEEGKDIGHYGRLVFVMVARHFLDEETIVGYLKKDRDFSEPQAHALYQQVQEHDYNPPRRERILEWQQGQAFSIIPDPEDPDAGNVYRNLEFPEGIYENISEYHEHKVEAHA